MTILESIQKKHNSSGGKCGLYIPQICQETGLDWFDVRKELNSLCEQKLIEIKDGINGKLIFISSRRISS